MKSTPTPIIDTAYMSEEIALQFCPSGSKITHVVTVPAGTRCVKLDGGSSPWVVDDLSFIEDKGSILSHNLGEPINEAEVRAMLAPVESAMAAPGQSASPSL